jgi:DNA mismatch endonuclease (patch repair protein)
VKLCRSVRRLGLRFRTNVSALPGCPDLVFERARLAVFVDGDFWHGRRLSSRLQKLSRGHNSEYWIRKIKSNVARDRQVQRELRSLGWTVIRVWETEVKRDLDFVTGRIVKALRQLEQTSGAHTGGQ